MLSKDEVMAKNTKLSGTAMILATHFKNKPFEGNQITKALGVTEEEAKQIYWELGAYCFLGRINGSTKCFIILNPDQRMMMIKNYSTDIDLKVKAMQDAKTELGYLNSAIFMQKLS